MEATAKDNSLRGKRDSFKKNSHRKPHDWKKGKHGKGNSKGHRGTSERGSNGSSSATKVSAAAGKNWTFEVDYNDHFETPLIAYEHLLPAIDILLESTPNKSRAAATIYDPYFCQGRMVEYVQSLGVGTVINNNRDFYRDIRSKCIPSNSCP